MKKYGIACICMIFICAGLGAEHIVYSANGSYRLVERTDLRRYENGRYAGLTSREVRSFIAADANAGDYVGADSPYMRDTWYDGNFYVNEGTKRAALHTTPNIHTAIPSIFHISSDGRMTMYQDNGYPSFRSFPMYPNTSFAVGEKWQAQGERAVDPMYKGLPTRMPMYVEYTFIGKELYNDEPVYRLTAEWATRYDIYHADPNGDPDLKSATGSHKAFILVSCNTGAAVLVKDQVDETFVYANGKDVQLKGTITLFTEVSEPLERSKLIPALNRIATVKASDADNDFVRAAKEKLTDNGAADSGGDAPTNNIVVEETNSGLRLSVRDVRFLPDSPQVLPGESERLDEIASVLRLAPDTQFLVEGHTALAGKPREEQSLSEERARAIAQELVSRGIPAEQFICKGLGSSIPVADNFTEEGRSQNRRVEITILE